jgi:glycosyltransferase involved in cell wall biosynthesis
VADHVGALAHGLPAHGWEVEVAGPTSASIYDSLRAAGVAVHAIDPLARGYGRPWCDYRAGSQLGSLLDDGGFDLLHCHSTKAGLVGRLVGRRRDAKVIYTPNCFAWVGEVPGWRRAVAPPVERALGRSTDKLICVAEAERREALEHRIADRSALELVYNGSSPCESFAESPFPDDGRPLVAAVSVLRRQKRLDVLIEAAPLILAAVPETRIGIVGEGPEEAALRAKLASMDAAVREAVEMMPFVPPSARYLNALDVFVLCSSWEAFPIAVLEALACGVPQVCTDVGGTAEALTEETGIVIPPRSPRALADAVVDLLRDPERRARMSAAGRARHAALFTQERVVAETAAVYERALHSAPAPATPGSGARG